MMQEERICKKMLLQLGFEPITEHETDGYTHKDLSLYKLKYISHGEYGFIFNFSNTFTNTLTTIWELLEEKERIMNIKYKPANQFS